VSWARRSGQNAGIWSQAPRWGRQGISSAKCQCRKTEELSMTSEERFERIEAMQARTAKQIADNAE